MRTRYKIFLASLMCCVLFSCVSSDKYKELVQVKDYLEQENTRLKEGKEANRNLRAKIRKNTAEADKAQAELTELRSSFSILEKNYQDLANRYNTLIANNKHVGIGSATEKQYWEEQLAQNQLDLEEKERQLTTLRYTLAQKDKRVAELLELLRSKE